MNAKVRTKINDDDLHIAKGTVRRISSDPHPDVYLL